MTTFVPANPLGEIDWTALRARRSPFWRPGMNTRHEPFVALAETNQGHVAVPCGRSVDRAREVITRWQALADAGVIADDRHLYGAALVGPRGEIVEAWKREGDGSVPDPAGPPRWAPLRRINQPCTCARCGAARWPGCYVAIDQAGCSECMPADEVHDPRVWPAEGARPAAEPTGKRR